MNLLVFNLRLDADDPVLGHTTSWTNALARRVDHVSVITMSTGRVSVADNVAVHSLGKELGYSEPRRLARFYRVTIAAMRERRIDACFAHMAPLFAILFAPLGRGAGIPTLLWHTHTAVTPTLRLAHALTARSVTASLPSFRISSDKLFEVGHGIDVSRLDPPRSPGPGYERTAVSVGRISPSKRLDEMIRAVAILRNSSTDLSLRLIGAPAKPGDSAYLSRLRRATDELRLDAKVAFDGSVAHGEVASAYHRGGLFLSLSQTGLDKAILESVCCGCLPVSPNDSFTQIAREQGLEWLIPDSGAEGLAACIAALLERPASERADAVAELRKTVVERHSLDRLADTLVGHLRELTG